MFKLQQSENYSWPVKVKVPVDGGLFIEQTFDAVFKRLAASKTKELVGSENMNDIEFAKSVLIGWKGVTDDSGNDVPFSDGTRDSLLDVPSVATAVVESYLMSSSGMSSSGQGDGAKRKN